MAYRTLHGASKSERLAARYIPKDARLVPGPAGCAIYSYNTPRGFAAMAFRGSAARPELNIIYRTEANRTEAIDAFRAGVKSSQEFKATRAAAKAAWVNPLRVGDLLHTSWGYDQTNTEFFAVTRVSGRRVWVREIAADYEETGFMSGKTWPAMPIRFVGEETMHTAQPSGERGACVKIDDVRTATPTDGRAYNVSSYA